MSAEIVPILALCVVVFIVNERSFLLHAADSQPPCPHKCTCTGSDSATEGSVVTCRSQDLRSLPRNIPSDTVTLDLSDNKISVVDLSTLIGGDDGHVTGMTSLRELNLRGNVIESIVSHHDVLDQQTLKYDAVDVEYALLTLDLAENHLRGSLNEGIFHGVAAFLQSLDLSGNRLTNIGRAFRGCYQMSRLDLRGNALTSIDNNSFSDLVNLRYLRLDNNRISLIHKMALLPLVRLAYIVLKENPLAEKTEEFHFNTTSLSYMDVSGCGWTSIPRGIPSSVRYLQIRRNKITRLTVDSFSELSESELSILVLDENGLKIVEDGAFAGLQILQQLWLNGNKLTAIPRRLPDNLKRLLLDSNVIAGSIGGGGQTSGSLFPTSITTLSFMGNQITSVTSDAFRGLVDLTALDLSANAIDNLSPELFASNSRLQTLHLSKNPLRRLPADLLDGLTSLETLTLAYLPPNTTAGESIFRSCAKSLRRLDMDASSALITQFVEMFARPQTHLHLQSRTEMQAGMRQISLRKSDLQTLDYAFITSFTNLTSFSVSGTRWHCDGALAWLRDWLLQEKTSQGSQVSSQDAESSLSVSSDDVANSDAVNTCLTPVHLIGRALVTLTDSELEGERAGRANLTDRKAVENTPDVTFTYTFTRAQPVPSTGEIIISSTLQTGTVPASLLHAQHRIDEDDASHYADNPKAAKNDSIFQPQIVTPLSGDYSDAISGLGMSAFGAESEDNTGAVDTVAVITVCIVASTVLAAIFIVALIIRLSCTKNRNKNRDNEVRCDGQDEQHGGIDSKPAVPVVVNCRSECEMNRSAQNNYRDVDDLQLLEHPCDTSRPFVANRRATNRNAGEMRLENNDYGSRGTNGILTGSRGGLHGRKENETVDGDMLAGFHRWSMSRINEINDKRTATGAESCVDTRCVCANAIAERALKRRLSAYGSSSNCGAGGNSGDFSGGGIHVVQHEMMQLLDAKQRGGYAPGRSCQMNDKLIVKCIVDEEGEDSTQSLGNDCTSGIPFTDGALQSGPVQPSLSKVTCVGEMNATRSYQWEDVC